MPRLSEETPLDGDAERHEAKETHGGGVYIIYR